MLRQTRFLFFKKFSLFFSIGDREIFLLKEGVNESKSNFYVSHDSNVEFKIEIIQYIETTRLDNLIC